MKKRVIALTDKSQIRISKDTVNDVTFVQLRVWVVDRKTGTWIPTKKGVAFKPSLTNEVMELLKEVNNDPQGDGASA